MDASTLIALANGNKGSTQYCVIQKTPFDETGLLKIGACKSMKLEVPLTSIRWQQDMNLFIKWNQLQNGSGDFGPVILIVAVAGLQPGEFYCAKVQGVTNGIDKTVEGLVYFAATRCMAAIGAKPDAVDHEDAEEGICITVAEVGNTPTPNSAVVAAAVIATPTANMAVATAYPLIPTTLSCATLTPPHHHPYIISSDATPTANIAGPASSLDCNMAPWEHMLRETIIPAIKGYADRYGMRDSTGKVFHSELAIDGELVILKETQKPEVQQALRINAIGMVKGRASGTEFDNACGKHNYCN